MLETPEKRTTLTDQKGAAHQYLVLPHGAMSGFPLGAELLDLLGETLRFERGVGACIEGLAKGVLKRGDVKLILRLVEHVSRDGERLNDEAVFNRVFQANYGELLRLLVWVIEVNFAGFSPAAVELIGGRIERALSTSSAPRGLSFLSALLTGDFGALSKLAKSPSSTSETDGPPAT
jgi:hypothetical protein